MRSRSHSSLRWFSAIAALVALVGGACGNSDSIGALGQGGSGGTNTPAASGGVSGGGAKGTGGVPGSGGVVASGGLLGIGGSVATGGAVATGGVVTTGGAGGLQPGTGGAGQGGTLNGLGGARTGGAGGGAGGLQPGTGGAGVGGTKSGSGGAGSGGAGGADGGRSEVPVSLDGGDLAALCISTGGQTNSQLCCGGVSDYPNSCLTGACGCAPTSSHTITVCTCPNGSCFTATTGCIPRDEVPGGTLDAGPDGNVVCGNATCSAGEYCCNPESSLCTPVGFGCIVGGGGEDAQGLDSNGCSAWPDGDATFCGGTRPAHYYGCKLTMLADPCVLLSVGSLTNTFCCP